MAVYWNRYPKISLRDFLEKLKVELKILKLKYHELSYATIDPFFTPNMAK
jgi:hypothetical protein